MPIALEITLGMPTTSTVGMPNKSTAGMPNESIAVAIGRLQLCGGYD